MELTERERRILAELESQFPAAESEVSAPDRPAQQGLRPRWTVLPSAVLGFLLLVAGIVLAVPSAVVLAVFLLGWWLAPRLPGLLRSAGRLGQ